MWVVVDIGCIECGVSSGIVGVFDTEEKARAQEERCNADGGLSWRDGGQHVFESFPLARINVVNRLYETTEED